MTGKESLISPKPSRENSKSAGSTNVPTLRNAELVTSGSAQTGLPTPPENDAADRAKEWQSEFQVDLFRLLGEASTLDGFRTLLKSNNQALRLKAWELAMKHAVPVQKEGEVPIAGGINFFLNVPRPGGQT